MAKRIKPEIKELIDAVKAARCLSVDQAIVAIDNHFKKVIWSAEKAEWENNMTPNQKNAFAKAIFLKAQ